MLGPFSIAVIAMISTGIVDTLYLGRLEDPNNPNIARAVLAAIELGEVAITPPDLIIEKVT